MKKFIPGILLVIALYVCYVLPVPVVRDYINNTIHYVTSTSKATKKAIDEQKTCAIQIEGTMDETPCLQPKEKQETKEPVKE